MGLTRHIELKPNISRPYLESSLDMLRAITLQPLYGLAQQKPDAPARCRK
jgi:hypothetical protein